MERELLGNFDKKVNRNYHKLLNDYKVPPNTKFRYELPYLAKKDPLLQENPKLKSLNVGEAHYLAVKQSILMKETDSRDIL